MNQKFPSSNEPRFQNEAKREDEAYLHKGEKWFINQKLCTFPRFEKEAGGNSDH